MPGLMTPGAAASRQALQIDLDAASLATRIVEAPFLSPDDIAASETKFERWLAELGAAAEADGLRQVFAAAPKARELIAGLFAHSPYLSELVRADAARLLRLLVGEPEAEFRSLLAHNVEALTRIEDEAGAMRILRRIKNETALLIALADIGAVWSVMQVTRALTELADNMVQAAVRYLLCDAMRRDRLKPADPREPETGSGYIVLAMGKMGAFELNYSSDIDLIVFFDPAAPLAPEVLMSNTSHP
jgi:glutamate-ammonia-ligase adenylyltransferase